jgi:hypothetical protein
LRLAALCLLSFFAANQHKCLSMSILHKNKAFSIRPRSGPIKPDCAIFQITICVTPSLHDYIISLRIRLQRAGQAMNDIVGIDLGATNSLIATVEAGIPYVIADAEGERLTPSVVHFPEAGAPPLAGRAAARLRAVHPGQTVYSIKRFMGWRGAEIPREEMLVTYPVRGDGAGPVTVEIQGRRTFHDSGGLSDQHVNPRPPGRTRTGPRQLEPGPVCARIRARPKGVAHALDDLKARQWIEAKLRAGETLAATRKALVDCAAELDADYKVKVEAAVKAVAGQAALEQGDPAALKSALAALDEATQPLADLLMDKTLDALLRQRGLVK